MSIRTHDQHGGDPAYCEGCREEYERREHERMLENKAIDDLNERMAALQFALPGIAGSPEDIAALIRAAKEYCNDSDVGLCKLDEAAAKVTIQEEA